MTYTHLTTNELVMIESYYKNHLPVSQIAKSLNRTRQTIYKVLHFLKQGNSAMDYCNTYKSNKKRCGRRQIQLDTETKEFVQAYLEQDWSMDVIKGTFSEKIPCSMRTLYRLADRGLFSKEDFPWKGKRKSNGHKEKRGKQAFKRSLEERATTYPQFQEEFGHLEGDTIVGKDSKSASVTLAERQSKLIVSLKTKSRKANDVTEAIQGWLAQFSVNLFKSITFDCGKEFSKWKDISNQHDIDIFFADPGCPGQRGLNEHSNGLLRRHGLPKQMDFNEVSQEFLSAIADKRNHIPRKSLGYQTPYQVFSELVRVSSLI